MIEIISMAIVLKNTLKQHVASEEATVEHKGLRTYCVLSKRTPT